jgi:4-amino-4-deoxy-L-arabinose transferase-like glycosyltransferase
VSKTPRKVPNLYVGPDTSAQLFALRQLEDIATCQHEPPGRAAFGGAKGGLAAPAPPSSDVARLAPGPEPLSAPAPARQAPPARAPEQSAIERGVARLFDRWRRLPILGRLPLALAATLVVQVLLSLRLLWSNTAFADEALYLWAGHLEWAHWLHGTPIASAAMPSYFSGAPVVYPPLGALADSIGGLAAARLLSLVFMLGATCLLYVTTRRLFDSNSAAFATALFAGVGSTQFLGAFATYDAMALFLLTLATWAAVRAAACRAGYAAGLLTLSGASMALADACKYASTLFDPVVISVALLALWRTAGRRRALWGTALLAGVAVLLVGGALLAGGHSYWYGISLTTLNRADSSTPIPGVLFISGKWVGAVAFLAVCGAAATFWSRDWRTRLLGGCLACAVFLAPAEQARIHTLTSLFKHVGYGAWFACIVAGYALAALLRAVPPVKVQAALRVGVAAVVLSSTTGVAYAGDHFDVWPNTTQYVAELRPLLASAHGQVLIDIASVPEYYLQISDYEEVTNSSYFAYTDPVTHKRITQPAAAYADAIEHGYFALISLTYGNAPTVYDPGIVRDIDTYGGYRLVMSLPYRTATDEGHFLTWVRADLSARSQRAATAMSGWSCPRRPTTRRRRPTHGARCRS